MLPLLPLLLLLLLQESCLADGAGHRPAYSLRTLCRALDYARRAAPAYGLTRSLWDGLSMSFVTQVGRGVGGTQVGVCLVVVGAVLLELVGAQMSTW